MKPEIAVPPVAGPRSARGHWRAAAHAARQRGVTMVELMLALLVGLLIGVAALSNAQIFGSVGRTQLGTGSALSSGSSALGVVKYDLQMAGLGFYSDAQALCPRVNIYANGATLAVDRVFQAATINRLADGSDEIELFYGTSIAAGAGSRTLSPMASPMAPVQVYPGAAPPVGQAVLFSSPLLDMACTVAQVSSVAATGASATLGFAGPSRFNPPDWAAAFPGALPYPTLASMSPLGDLVWRRYFVRDTNLMMVDVLTDAETVVAEGVVRVRAQYGLSDGPASTTIATWQDATAAAPLSANDRTRLRALRVGVVSVNTQRERPVAGTACDATVAAPILWPGETVDVSGRANWQCFRYRTFWTVVALRNMQWGQQL